MKKKDATVKKDQITNDKEAIKNGKVRVKTARKGISSVSVKLNKNQRIKLQKTTKLSHSPYDSLSAISNQEGRNSFSSEKTWDSIASLKRYNLSHKTRNAKTQETHSIPTTLDSVNSATEDTEKKNVHSSPNSKKKANQAKKNKGKRRHLSQNIINEASKKLDDLIESSTDESLASQSVISAYKLSNKTYKTVKNIKALRHLIRNLHHNGKIDFKNTTKAIKKVTKSTKRVTKSTKKVTKAALKKITHTAKSSQSKPESNTLNIFNNQKSGTFDYLNDKQNQSQYVYQFKRKKEHKNGNLKTAEPNNSVKKVPKNSLKKENTTVTTTTNSIPKVSNTTKNKSKRKSDAYKKSKEERENIGKDVKDSVVDKLSKRLVEVLVMKSSKIMIILLSSIFFLIPIIVPVSGGTAAIMEGYAVVVRLTTNPANEVKGFLDNVVNFTQKKWSDLIYSNVAKLWTDTHGAQNVILDDIASVDKFMEAMCEYEKNKITNLKENYEKNGYTVQIIHSGKQVKDVDVSSGNQTIATGGSEFNGATHETIRYCWSKIVANGYTDIVAAGFIGNLCQETSGINPNAGSSHYGIVQWSDDRRTNLINWCTSHGYDWSSLDGQLNFAIKAELKSRLGDRRHKILKKSQTVTFATDYICVYYEGAEGQQQPERRKYAQNAYNLCAGTTVEKEAEVKEETEEITDYEVTLDSLYSSDDYGKILKPIWLSVMYGKYAYKPTEVQMADTAEKIGELLNAYSTVEDEDDKVVYIYIYEGTIDDVITHYYPSKYGQDYDMALALLEYYDAYNVEREKNGIGSTTNIADGDYSTKYGSLTSDNENINQMINLALSKVGNKYVWGGNDIDNGIDCSGFTQWCYKQIGINLPRTSSDQSKTGTEVTAGQVIKPGDLCFYGSNGTVNHVALYIGNGKIVHSSNSKPYPQGGIKVSKWSYRPTLHIRRIIN